MPSTTLEEHGKMLINTQIQPSKHMEPINLIWQTIVLLACQLIYSRYHISIDPINSSIELSEEALEFQHQHQLYFCNLWKVTEYTIIGINDEEMNLFYEILSYEFTNNQNNILDGSVSFFWNSLRKLTISGLFLSIQDWKWIGLADDESRQITSASLGALQGISLLTHNIDIVLKSIFSLFMEWYIFVDTNMNLSLLNSQLRSGNVILEEQGHLRG